MRPEEAHMAGKVRRALPKPIRDATPEEVASVVLRQPKKRKWRYLTKKDTASD